VSDALLVSSSFLPGRGGIESHLSSLCAALSPRLAVLAPATRDGRPLPRDLGYPTRPMRGSGLLPHPGVAREIMEAAASEGTDRVLFGTPWPLSLLGPRLASAGLRYAVVIHGAETLLPGAMPFVRGRLAHALARAELLLPVSDFTARRLEAMLASRDPAPPFALLRARVDLDRFTPSPPSAEMRERLGLGDDDRVVLFFGRLVRRKGAHRLVEAYEDLAARVPNLTIVIAGTGREESNLRGLARARAARVTFAGPVRDEDAPALYSVADVFAFPVADRWAGLDTEGLGVVLLEASASGLPCVTGRSGGTPEAVVHPESGFVVDARNRDELVHALARVLDDRANAERMGRAGRRHVAHNFASAAPRALLDWLT
jgi:phosphatidylinositol alpha-1,6-mannosyltransferase